MIDLMADCRWQDCEEDPCGLNCRWSQRFFQAWWQLVGNHEKFLLGLVRSTYCDFATFRAVKAKHGGKWPVHVKKVVETKPAKSPRFYPAEDIPKPFDRL
jgi:hypothetical protein